MKEAEHQSIGRYFRFASLASIIMTLVVVFVMYQVYQLKYSSVMNEYISEEKTAVDITTLYIADKIEHIYVDMLFLSDAKHMQAFLDTPEGEKENDEVKQLLYSFSKEHTGLTQIRILDKSGMERIRVNKVEDKVTIVEDEELQDKSNRYYFIDTKEIKEKQLYISNFDLNIEYGKIVVPYEPTIRFIVPLFDSQGERFGIIIININGIEFLKIIREYDLANMVYKNIGLLDSDNYWSLNTKKEDYLDNALIIKNEQQDEIHQLMEKITSNYSVENGMFEKNNIHYVFRKIELPDLNHYIFESPDFSWYIVGYYNVGALIDEYQFLLKYIIPITVLYGFLGAILAYAVVVVYQTKEKNHLMLIASTYVSDNSRDGIFILNSKKKIIYTNSVFETMFGTNVSALQNEIINRVFKEEFHSDDDKSDTTVLWKDNLWTETTYNSYLHKHLTIKAVRDSKQKVVYYIGIYMHPLKDEHSLLYSDKGGDGLLLIDLEELREIGGFIKDNNERSDISAVMVIQIDGSIKKTFDVNQNLHGQFISLVQERLKNEGRLIIEAIPRTDLLVLTDKRVEKKEGYEQWSVDYLENTFSKVLIELEVSRFDYHIHIGTAFSDKDSSDGFILVRDAMIALEVLLRFRKEKCLIYDENYYAYIKEDMSLREELKGAFSSHEFFVVYQPQYRLSDNKIIGVEALVRWKNPRVGLVSPERFISMLEESDEINKLGITVLDLIISDFLNYSELDSPLRISFNLSAKEFMNLHIIELLIDKIKQFKYKQIRFCFEITEMTMIENLEYINDMIARIHRENIEVAIDDFGTGYSSLGYLKKLTTDELKIDRMFIKDYPEMDDGKLIKAIISMGKEMELSLVSEGVETKEQLQLIRGMGCDVYQGYYGSKPVGIDKLMEMLN